MNNWRDPRQVQAALTPTDNHPPDGNVYCYRAGGELYVVVPPSKWKRLREQGRLNSLSKAIRADIQCKQEQTMSTAKVVQIGSEGERAFERIKPLLDVLRNDIKKASASVAKEYEKLPKLEKAVFAEKVKQEYGWSQERLKTFAQIGREFPDKQALISRSSTCAKIDDLDPAHMEQIIRIDNDLLKKAAKQGIFDRPVSVSQIKLVLPRFNGQFRKDRMSASRKPPD